MTTDSTLVESTSAQLRRTEPVITDSGFTRAVMAQLPRTRKLSTWQKNTILLAATTLGSAFVAWQAPVTAIPALLDAASADWPALLIAAVIATYGAAITTIWTAHRRHW
jgi:hypothetical protein